MKNPHQWLARIGGHLNKTVSAENNHSFSFYGKVMLLKTFGDDKKNTNWPMTSPLILQKLSLKTGLLSCNLALHEISYQQKLQKTGITGASFTYEVRYQF
ncbi:hypothetical protein FOL54_06610 [Bartonella quintana]|nr:hypothetical protein FOL54_06610 [Bartonella quintana]